LPHQAPLDVAADAEGVVRFDLASLHAAVGQQFEDLEHQVAQFAGAAVLLVGALLALGSLGLLCYTRAATLRKALSRLRKQLALIIPS